MLRTFAPLCALTLSIAHPLYAMEALEVFECRTETLQQHLELNPTPSRVRDLQSLDPKPQFIFLIDIKSGNIPKAFYGMPSGIQEMTRNLVIHSTAKSGITTDDATTGFLFTIQLSKEHARQVDTFVVRVYGRTGTGAFLLSSTKLGSESVVTTSFTGRCTSVPSSLLQLEAR